MPRGVSLVDPLNRDHLRLSPMLGRVKCGNGGFLWIRSGRTGGLRLAMSAPDPVLSTFGQRLCVLAVFDDSWIRNRVLTLSIRHQG